MAYLLKDLKGNINELPHLKVHQWRYSSFMSCPHWSSIFLLAELLSMKPYLTQQMFYSIRASSPCPSYLKLWLKNFSENSYSTIAFVMFDYAFKKLDITRSVAAEVRIRSTKKREKQTKWASLMLGPILDLMGSGQSDYNLLVHKTRKMDNLIRCHTLLGLSQGTLSPIQNLVGLLLWQELVDKSVYETQQWISNMGSKSKWEIVFYYFPRIVCNLKDKVVLKRSVLLRYRKIRIVKVVKDCWIS